MVSALRARIQGGCLGGFGSRVSGLGVFGLMAGNSLSYSLVIVLSGQWVWQPISGTTDYVNASPGISKGKEISTACRSGAEL